MHVQVAAIPALAGCDGRGIEAGGVYFIRPYKMNVRLVVGGVALAQIGDADEQLPGAGRQRSGQIRWRCIGDANAECVLVTAAPAAKALGIEQSKIERGVVFPAAVAEGDRPAV